jgi:hypothetical protein
VKREQVESGMRVMGIEPTSFNGKWVQARCPFTALHSGGRDKHPSFGVSVGGKSFYSCFTCKSKGPFADLPQHLEMDPTKRAELINEFNIAEAVGVDIEPDSYEVFDEAIPALPEEVYGNLFLPLDTVPEAAEYCENRELDLETAERLGIVAWPEDKRIMFPVRGFDGQLYGWQGRAYSDEVKPKQWNTEGLIKTSHLLGAEHADMELPNVLVEGLFAFAAFHAFGIPDELGVNVLAVLGSDLSIAQADMLTELGQPVTFFFDGDKAGKIGVWGNDKKEGGIHLLSRAGVPVSSVEYPRGILDPDDLFDDQIIEMIKDAKRYVRPRRRPGK